MTQVIYSLTGSLTIWHCALRDSCPKWHRKSIGMWPASEREPLTCLFVTTDSEEEQVTPKNGRTAIKSGKVRTADTTVLKEIVWLQELVYDPSDRPAAYDDLLLPLFIQGYLAFLHTEKPQKKDIMLRADAAIYGWNQSGLSMLFGSSSWRTDILTGGMKPQNFSFGEL